MSYASYDWLIVDLVWIGSNHSMNFDFHWSSLFSNNISSFNLPYHQQCYYFPPNWGGWGGLFPPQYRAQKKLPPQSFPPNLELEKSFPPIRKSSNSWKSLVFRCFWVRICSESVKNVIFRAAPAAGQRKGGFLVIFGHFGIFWGVLSPPPQIRARKKLPPNLSPPTLKLKWKHCSGHTSPCLHAALLA